MKLIKRINNLSKVLEGTKGFNLDTMANDAVKVFLDIKDHMVARTVLSVMETSIKTNTNPITGKPFSKNGRGLTRPIMEKVVRKATKKWR